MAHPMKSACSSESSRVRNVTGYRKGGAVHKSDAKADKKMFAKKFEPKLKAEGDKPKARLDKKSRAKTKRADGGPVSKLYDADGRRLDEGDQNDPPARVMTKERWSKESNAKPHEAL